VTAGDLSPTPTRLFDVDLEGAVSSGAGDGQPDRVIVQGTEAADKAQVSPVSGEVHVTGLAVEVRIAHPEAANDAVVLETFGGDDEVAGSNGLAALIRGLTVDSGAGNDTIFGGDTRDVVIAGDGNDFVDGNRADDVAFLGSDDDTFVWDPGDGSDTLEGQAGADTMLFNGAGVAERVDVSANGGRVRFFRDVASITMDLDDVERVDFKARGGADTITVNDLSGTDLTAANLDLEGTTAGAGDGQPDSVIVNATNGDDVATVAGSGSAVSVFGLSAQVNVAHPEPADDRLTINMLAGDDVLEASGLPAGLIQLVGNGGDGDDVLIGSAGPDVLNGDAGDDVLLGGPGLDVLDGGPGDNIVIQD
jgi:Ca2+-binding RTX toxin-like protein